MDKSNPAKFKLKLAQNIIADYCNNKTMPEQYNPALKEMQELEKKYNKSKGRNCDLSDFCIRLSDIPQIHYELMISINWLNDVTEKPVKSQNGFYKSAYSYEQGVTRIEYFITVNKYIKLLFVELNILGLYNKSAA
ncbi:MAG: hypothetical protein K0R14_170 [Burkholderiales bacterium]|jgi:hypothetical protein|nr:hypothetical protein [Burkholderiales bacterium]